MTDQPMLSWHLKAPWSQACVLSACFGQHYITLDTNKENDQSSLPLECKLEVMKTDTNEVPAQ